MYQYHNEHSKVCQLMLRPTRHILTAYRFTEVQDTHPVSDCLGRQPLAQLEEAVENELGMVHATAWPSCCMQCQPNASWQKAHMQMVWRACKWVKLGVLCIDSREKCAKPDNWEIACFACTQLAYHQYASSVCVS